MSRRGSVRRVLKLSMLFCSNFSSMVKKECRFNFYAVTGVEIKVSNPAGCFIVIYLSNRREDVRAPK